MTKKIAVINDLSGFGKCSLTAAIPVIAVMGVQPCPLPTAVLSAQTGYGHYYLDDYTDRMKYFTKSWKEMGETFDGIYTGFMASEEQIIHTEEFLDCFYREDLFLLVDPVMGDDGRTYTMFTPRFLEAMKKLALRSKVITPNLTELCLLTGRCYGEMEGLERDVLMGKIRQMAEELIQKGIRTVVVTGIRFNGTSGERRIGNLVVSDEGSRLLDFSYIGGSFSGTGDLFASVIAGGIVRGDDMIETCKLAGQFIERSMKDAAELQIPRNAGTEFEQHLGMLIPGIEKSGRN